MDRRTRTFIVIAVAVISATVASASVYRAVNRMPVRQVEAAHAYAIVAARPLTIGTRLTASDVTRVAWPSSTPLAGSFADLDEVVGRGIVTSVAVNEPITESKLAPKAAGSGLAPAIPDGYRAISVKVNEVIGVAGFAVPGAHVDVVATVRRSDGNAIARVLIANVPVLTAGTRYDQEQAPQAKPIPSTVVTLVVTPEQAERIALASTEGNITLMLRNPLDVAQPRTPGADLRGLVSGEETPAVAPQAPRVVPITSRTSLPAAVPVATIGRNTPPVPAAYTVEVIRAGKRTEETIP
jgi:pilus assembly protein CpaB